MYENECDVTNKFTHEICGPRFNYDGADLVSPEDGDEAEEDDVECGNVKKKKFVTSHSFSYTTSIPF